MADEKKSDEEFQIKDRRRFTEGGQRKETQEGAADIDGKGSSETPSGGPDSPSAQAGTDKKEKSSARTSKRPDLPEVNFSTFIFSLSSSIVIHLGLVPDPSTGKTFTDLPLAKQTIDILSMLQEKTRGNLTQDETKLMENLMFDLKMRYVEAVKKEPS